MVSKRGDVRWQLFAWQGVRIEVPEDWNPGIVEGTVENGYFRLGDAECSRLEVKWRKVRTKQPVAGFVDNYLADLAKTLKKKKLPFPVRRDTRLAKVAGVESECFEWQADAASINMAVHCRECGRLSIVRVLSKADEPIRPIAKRVLASFRDHAACGRVPWSAYGLRFSLPETYALDRSLFQPGRQEMRFVARRRTAVGLRIGLAEMLLRKRTLADVIGKDPVGKSWSERTEFVEEKVRDHDGVLVRIVPRRRPLRSFFRGETRAAVAWHCGPSNAVFLAQWSGPREMRSELDGFVESFVCH